MKTFNFYIILTNKKIYINNIKYKMVQQRKSLNQQRRSRRKQQAGTPKTVCAEGQRVFNTACVETCPPGTYEEPDRLPLECSSDTWLNRSATKTRLAAKKVGRATAAAAKSAASATAAAARSAASATAAFGRRQKARAAAKMYESCKAYVASYDAALKSGQDVSEVVPPNPDQIAAEVKEEIPNEVVTQSDEVVTPQLRTSRRQTRRY